MVCGYGGCWSKRKMNSPSPERNRRSSFDHGTQKETLSTRIQSFASNSGVGHLVGIAEQNERKSMKDQINELKEEVSRLGLSHLIENNVGVGMQSELKMLKGILAEYEKNTPQLATETAQTPASQSDIRHLQVPRRNSFARELVSQAESMGIETLDLPQPLTRPGSNRRLSTVIKSVASNSGVGHLVGIAEQSNRKPMKVQLEELKQEISELGLSHLINESHKTLSLSAEIKALKKILSDHQQDEIHSLESRDIISPSFSTPQDMISRHLPRRDSFAKQLIQTAKNIGIQTLDPPQPLTRPGSNRRLSTVIKSVASNSGVGHLVGIAEQSNRKPMKVQLEELKQEISELGLSHLINESHKTLSLSAEIKALKKILSDYRDTSYLAEPESFSQPSPDVNSMAGATKTKQYIPFLPLDDHQLHHSEDADEALNDAHREIEKLKATVKEMTGLVEMQRDEILRLQGINDENNDLLSIQGQLLREQSSSGHINELMRVKIILELKDKFCEDLQQQLADLLHRQNDMKTKYESLLNNHESVEAAKYLIINDPETQGHELLKTSLLECQESLAACQQNLRQKEHELEIQESKTSTLLDQHQQISINAERLIEEMQKCLQEKNLADAMIKQLNAELEATKKLLERRNIECNELTKQCNDHTSFEDTMVQQLRNELLDAQDALHSLEVRFNTILEENKKLSEDLSGAISCQNLADSNTREIQAQYYSLLSDNQMKTHNLLKLENTLESYRSQLLLVEDRLGAKDGAIQTLSQDVEKLSVALKLASDQLIDKESRELTLMQQIKSLQEIRAKSEQDELLFIELRDRDVSALQSSLNELLLKNESMSQTIAEYEKKETKYLKDIHDLNDLLTEQNQFLSDAADSLDVAEQEIEEFETELLDSQTEIKRLKASVAEMEEMKNDFNIQKQAFERKILKLQKDNTSLKEFLQNMQESQSSQESLIPNSLIRKTSLTASIYSDQRKHHVPLQAYVLLQNDNKRLLEKVSHLNGQINDLSEILLSTFSSKEKYCKRVMYDSSEVSNPVNSPDNAWMTMNQIPVFSGYTYLCNSYSNHQDGSIFRRVHNNLPNCSVGKDSQTSRNMEIQSSSVPLSPHEEYLKETIRRLRIGWTVIKIDASTRRDTIVHFDIQEKVLKFHPLRLDKDFYAQLSDTELYVSSISYMKKTDESGNSLPTHMCLTLVCKSEEILILKFVAVEERDLFYDGFLCALCHIDQSFRQTQILNFIFHDDISTSRYLKGNLVKKANGEYALLSFNRRSLLKHQSSIAVLQSAGVLSNSESKISEFLSSNDVASTSVAKPELVPSSFIDSSIEQIASPSVIATRTPSSTSIISGVTTMTETHPLVEDSPKESIKSTFMSNFGIFSTTNTVIQNDDLCDLGSLYGVSEENRPARKAFFSNKSSQNNTNRMTFSHENPISSSPSESGAKVVSKSQSLGSEIPQSTKKLSNSRSSFSKIPSKESSVGAENASRFMRRRSVLNPEGRASGLRSDLDDTLSQYKESDESSVTSNRNSGRSRRESASSLLALQTAQFRRRLSEQTSSMEEETSQRKEEEEIN